MQPGVPGGFDGTARQGQGKTLDFSAVWRLPRQKRTLTRRTVAKPPAFSGALTKRHSIGDQRYYGGAPEGLAPGQQGERGHLGRQDAGPGVASWQSFSRIHLAARHFRYVN